MTLDYASGTIFAELKHSRKTLVEGVSFSIREGESMALIGETGSGKTMIAMSLMGLLPKNVRMTQGRVIFRGRELKSPKDYSSLLGVEIVYIPQNGSEFLNPSRTIRSHLYDSLKKMKIRPGQMENIALDKLRAVGFEKPEELLNKYPFQLSGGMAQRITIAIAACSEAELIIADEPTNGLDRKAIEAFFCLLENIFPKAAKLVITHDISVAMHCDETLVLCAGKMMERGPSENLFKNPRHPYTKALISALPENGMVETPVLRPDSDKCPFRKRCTRATENCSMLHMSGVGIEWWCSEAT